MTKNVVGLAAAALTGLFVLSTGVEPAVAAHGGGGGHGGGGHSSGGGGRSSAGHVTSRSAISGNRTYGFTARHHRGHGRRIVAVPNGYYDYGYYAGTCAYEYNRAVATGSAYWWNRYEECMD